MCPEHDSIAIVRPPGLMKKIRLFPIEINNYQSPNRSLLLEGTIDSKMSIHLECQAIPLEF